MREGGTVVLKFFEGAPHLRTIAYIAFLTTLFDEVSIVKPTSSRPTNSERYVVAKGRNRERADIMRQKAIRREEKEIAIVTEVDIKCLGDGSVVPSVEWVHAFAKISERLAEDQCVHLQAALASVEERVIRRSVKRGRWGG